MICSICGTKVCGGPEEFEKHLLEYHFLRYQDYCELELTHKGKDSRECLKCGTLRSPLTTLMRDFYYLPCMTCFSDAPRKLERQETLDSIGRNLKSYYDYLLGDRYLQLFIVDPIYPRATLSYDYHEFKKVLGKLDLPSRNDIWFLDWIPGYPKIVGLSNLPGLKIVNLSGMYSITSGKNGIEVNNYKILFPEIASYEKQHFSRYNILNTRSERRTKRIKIGDTCYKFYKPFVSGGSNSIFKVIDKNTGEQVDLKRISFQDFIILKLTLMRNKTYMRLVFSIILELTKSVKVISDEVFLWNTIMIDPGKSLSLNITWLPEKINNNPQQLSTINISIL